MIESIKGSAGAYQLPTARPTGSKSASLAEKFESRVKRDAESGTLDTAKLQEMLTARFGDKASGIVDGDGNVDFEQMVSLLKSEQPADAVGSTQPPPRPSPQEMVGRIREDIESGNLSAADLKVNLAADFGDAAAGIVAEDGSVDYARMQDLFKDDPPVPPFGAQWTPLKETGGYGHRSSTGSPLLFSKQA